MDSILDEIQEMESRRDWLDLAMEVYAHLAQSTLHSSLRRKACHSHSDISQNEINIDYSQLCFGRDEYDKKELNRVLNSCYRQNDVSRGKEYFNRLGLDLEGCSLKLKLK